jgi:hypothetical protein
MSQGKLDLIPRKQIPNVAPAMSCEVIGEIPIGDEVWELGLHDGPIVRDGVSHASYADPILHRVEVDRFIPEPFRLVTACCAVAAVALTLEAFHRLSSVPLVGAVD